MGLWYPRAVQYRGPAWKHGYPQYGRDSIKRGSVWHSAEGNSLDVMHDILDGSRRASWHFTVGKTPSDGVEQHYPLDANCWHAGDVDDDGAVRANIDLVGIEFMGVAGEPLTSFQLTEGVAITQFCAGEMGFDRFSLYPKQGFNWTLAEHNMVSDIPTACPSGRVPWDLVLRMLTPKVEDGMLELVSTVGGAGLYTFLTNWQGYNYISSSSRIDRMQRTGKWPREAPRVLSDAEHMDLIALDRGQDIG